MDSTPGWWTKIYTTKSRKYSITNNIKTLHLRRTFKGMKKCSCYLKEKAKPTLTVIYKYVRTCKEKKSCLVFPVKEMRLREERWLVPGHTVPSGCSLTSRPKGHWACINRWTALPWALAVEVFFFGCAGSFIALRGLSLVVAPASHRGGFSCQGARALRSRASVVAAHGLSGCSTWALEHGLS